MKLDLACLFLNRLRFSRFLRQIDAFFLGLIVSSTLSARCARNFAATPNLLTHAQPVVEQIHQPDLDPRSQYSDHAHNVPTHLRLRAKDMLDARTNL